MSPAHSLFGARRELPIQQVVGHRHRMLGVRRRLEAPPVARPDAVLAHQPLHPAQPDGVATPAQLAVHAPRAVGALELGVNGLDQGDGLRVRQPGRVRRAAALPGAPAAGADTQHLAHVGQGVLVSMRIDPGVLHSASFAKYAVAFFRISTCIFSRAFSARSRDSSICSGVTGLCRAR